MAWRAASLLCCGVVVLTARLRVSHDLFRRAGWLPGALQLALKGASELGHLSVVPSSPGPQTPKLLGTGEIGSVWLMHDDKLGIDVALKQTPVLFYYGWMGNSSCVRDMVDVQMHTMVKNSPFVVPLLAATHFPYLHRQHGELVYAYLELPVMGGAQYSPKGPVSKDLEAFVASVPDGHLGAVNNYNMLQRILVQVAMSIVSIHKLGVIHKDLKLANFLLHGYTSEAPKLLLADFGLSEVVENRDVSTNYEGSGDPMKDWVDWLDWDDKDEPIESFLLVVNQLLPEDWQNHESWPHLASLQDLLRLLDDRGNLPVPEEGLDGFSSSRFGQHEFWGSFAGHWHEWCDALEDPFADMRE